MVELDPGIVDPSFVKDRLKSTNLGFDDLSKRSASEGRTLQFLCDRILGRWSLHGGLWA